eukprot:gene19107-29421_t
MWRVGSRLAQRAFRNVACPATEKYMHVDTQKETVFCRRFKGMDEAEKEKVIAEVAKRHPEVESDFDGLTADDVPWGTVPQIQPEHALAIVADKKAGGIGTILDVREPDEVAAWHLPFTKGEVLHIPMSTITDNLAACGIPDNLGTAENPCLIMCKAGSRSQKVANYLNEKGRKHVANISGGITAFPTEHHTYPS